MDKIKPPKDHTRLKNAIVSRFLHFCTSKAWVYICMFLSFGIFFALGIRDTSKMMDYGGWGIGITILFIALPHVIFRGVLRYRNIPRGYTLEQAQARWRLEEKSKQLKGAKSVNWKKAGKIIAFVVGYIGLLNLILVLVTTFDKSGIGIIAFIISAIVAPFVYIKIYRPNTLQTNASSILNSLMEAKYGIHYRKWILAFIVVGLGIIPAVMFGGLVGGIICIVLLIFIAVKARFEGKVKVRL